LISAAFCSASQKSARKQNLGVVITHMSLPRHKGWVWPYELRLTDFFLLSKAKNKKTTGKLNRL